MSVEFEMESRIDNRDTTCVFDLDAYTDEAILAMYNLDRDGFGAGATFTGTQLRQLRRFLEYCYPASEDPEHGPDPWEVGRWYPATLGAIEAPRAR